MRSTSGYQVKSEAVDAFRECADDAFALALSTAPVMLARAEKLHTAYLYASSVPDAFARGHRNSGSELRDLVERSIRAEVALALRVSETVASYELDRARLLVEDLPATRAALREARMLWDAAIVICKYADLLPEGSRGVFDERAAALGVELTPAQLRKELPRLREELHEVPLTERFTVAKERRSVWITPDQDGMCTVSAYLPAHVGMGVYNRLDRIARTFRDQEGEDRTLAQLRADAFSDLLTDGDIIGTTPDEDARPATYIPGIRAEVRITVPVLTAADKDDTPADLEGYGPIPADVARELVGTGSSFYRVLTDPVTQQVLSVGRSMRTAPRELRIYIQLRDQTCRFAGCSRRASTSEIDHTQEWEHGGETSSDNMMTLCVGHHHLRHGEKWTYTLHPDGTAEWTTPTGRKRTTRPPALPGSAFRPRFTDESPPPSFGPPPF